MTRSATGHATFHSLEFAAQLVVWAMRKRLHLLRNGHDDSDVARAFALGRLDAVHAALMSLIDVLVCGSPKVIELHEVACPCLAPYEVALLNAIASLQNGRDAQAKNCIATLLCRPALDLVFPGVQVMVRELAARGLTIRPIANPLEPRHALLQPSSRMLH